MDFITHDLACLQAVSCVLRKILPRQVFQLATALLCLLGHEEETPALQVPRLNLLIIGRHDSLQDNQRGCEEREFQEEFNQPQPCFKGRHSRVIWNY